MGGVGARGKIGEERGVGAVGGERLGAEAGGGGGERLDFGFVVGPVVVGGDDGAGGVEDRDRGIGGGVGNAERNEAGADGAEEDRAGGVAAGDDEAGDGRLVVGAGDGAGSEGGEAGGRTRTWGEEERIAFLVPPSFPTANEELAAIVEIDQLDDVVAKAGEIDELGEWLHHASGPEAGTVGELAQDDVVVVDLVGGVVAVRVVGADRQHPASGVEHRAGFAAFGEGAANDGTLVIDVGRPALIAAERAQIGERAVAEENGVLGVFESEGGRADRPSGGVDGGQAGQTAAEGADIGRGAGVIDHGAGVVAETVDGDMAGIVDGGRDACAFDSANAPSAIRKPRSPSSGNQR